MSREGLRWGILSTARVNERLVPAIQNSARCKVVAVASRDREKALSFATKWGIPRTYTGYDALLADPDIDVVYVPLPNAYHKEWTIRSAEAGKHVLCEKPLALTASDVDEMAAAAKRNGVIVQEATMYRYHPQTLRVRELVKQGVIGELRLIRGILAFNLLKEEDYRWDPKLGGGSLWDVGCYPVSLARTMVGEEPLEVMGWQVLSDSGVDLTFAGQMRFPSGAIAQISSSFRTTPHTEAELVGSEGRIYLDLPFVNRPGIPGHVTLMRTGSPSKATFGDVAASVDREVLTFEGIDAYQCQVEALAACVLDGAPAVVPIEESRGNIAAVVALYESARKNVPVPVRSANRQSA